MACRYLENGGVLFQNKLGQIISNGIIASLLALGPRLVSFSAPVLGPTDGRRFLYEMLGWSGKIFALN